MSQTSCPISYGSNRHPLPGGHQVQLIGAVPPNWTLRAAARAGSNSLEPASEKEYLLLGYDGLGPGGHIIWDSNVADGFDALWRDVVLIVDPDGATRWTIVGNTPSLPFDALTYGKINRVVIRAGVDLADSLVSWPAIEITSYCDGESYSDTIPIDYRPKVDTRPLLVETRGGLRLTAAQSILEIALPCGMCTHVEINAGLRIFCKQLGYTPIGDQLLADIFVYTEQAMFVR
jgi:hypothetical protein